MGTLKLRENAPRVKSVKSVAKFLVTNVKPTLLGKMTEKLPPKCTAIFRPQISRIQERHIDP